LVLLGAAGTAVVDGVISLEEETTSPPVAAGGWGGGSDNVF